jgi:tRNA modification GTPase
MRMNDTIFAVSTAPGRSGVAVVRISGPDAGAALEAMTGSPLPAARVATVRVISDPATGEALDRGLVLWFAGQASFTGEPSAELHLHGSRAVVDGVLHALRRLPGLRLAYAGEFTRRGFENGKLDLAQAEALGDLIAADTAAQRRQAVRGLEGAAGVAVAGWRDNLLHIRALLAAEIDFSDEGDVGDRAASGIDSLLQRLIAEMTQVLAGSHRGRLIAEGARVAIVGKPNSGKSTLLNTLAGSDAAIVSEHAGTTRDVIEVRLDWEGYPIVLVDTAGLRETEDAVEKIGVARALQRAAEADLVLHLDEAGDWDVASGAVGAVLTDERSIRVRTKCDIATRDQGDADVAISAHSGQGLGQLKELILSVFKEETSVGESVVVVQERQTRALEAAILACERAVATSPESIELRDHEVRAAERALEILVGRSGVEDVLGAVFGRFCVGK